MINFATNYITFKEIKMPIMLYPICWRDRQDCEPIHCIDAAPCDVTEDQLMEFQYIPECHLFAQGQYQNQKLNKINTDYVLKIIGLMK